MNCGGGAVIPIMRPQIVAPHSRRLPGRCLRRVCPRALSAARCPEICVIGVHLWTNLLRTNLRTTRKAPPAPIRLLCA